MAKIFEIAFKLNGQIASGFSGAMDSAKSQIAAYGAQISSLNAKQKGLKGQLSDVQASQAALNAAMDGSRARQAAYSAAMTDLNVKTSSYRQNIANLEARQQALTAKFNAGKISADQYNTGMVAISTKITQYKSRLATTTAEQNRLTEAFNRGRISEAQYRSQMDALNAKAREYTGNLKQVATEIEGVTARNAALRASMAANVAAQANFTNAVAGFRSTAATIAIAAAPLALAAREAINYEQAMAGVAKQVDGARDENLQYTETYYQMSDAVKSMSTELGIVPDKVAGAMEASARMGVQGAEGLREFTTLSVKMGEAFETDGEIVAEQMAKIANIRGIKIDTTEGRAQIRELADTINYLDDQTTAKGGEIINVMQRISGTAAQTSFSNGEIAAMGTTMLELGDTAEVASTGLNAFMTKLATAPVQGKSFQAALAQMGMDAKQLQEDFIKDSKGTTLKLLDQINQLDGAAKAEILTNMFGAEYQDNIAKLAAGTDKLRANFARLNEEGRAGSVDKEFQAKMQTTTFALNQARAAVSVMAVTIGDALIPSIAAGTSWLANQVMWVTRLAQEHPAVVQGILSMAAAVAGLVLAYKGFRVVSAGIELTRAAIVALQNSERAATVARWAGVAATKAMTAAQWLFNGAMAANPAALAIIAIIALIAILIIYWDDVAAAAVAAWDWIANEATWLWNQLVAGWDTVSGAVTGFISDAEAKIADFVSWAQNKWQGFKDFLANPISATVNWVQNQMGAPPAGVDLPGHAEGDIVGKGAHLAWFAEESPEAYIPINNSARSRGLVTKTAQLLGMDVGTGGGGVSLSAPITITVQGNADASTVAQIERAARDVLEELERKLQELEARRGRRSYA